MAPERRSELVAVRFTPAELAMLHELAEADGLYQSDVIRLLIRRTHVARFKKAKKKATRKSIAPRRSMLPKKSIAPKKAKAKVHAKARARR
jgi:hypothetical protein